MNAKETKKKRKEYRKLFMRELSSIRKWPIKQRLRVAWEILKGEWFNG